MTVGDATKMFWLIDSKGLITSDRKDAGRYPHHKTIFVRDMNGEQIASLEEAVNKIKPTAHIGLSAVGGPFTPSIISAIAAINKRSIIFPLSNPLTTGELVEPGQGNNMYIFTALGLGSVLSKASRVTDDMIYASAVSLANTLNASVPVNSAEPRLARLAPADAAAVVPLVAKVASGRPELDAARRAADAIGGAARRAHGPDSPLVPAVGAAVVDAALAAGSDADAVQEACDAVLARREDPVWELPYIDAVVRGLAAAGKPEYAAALLLQKAGDTATADAAFPRALRWITPRRSTLRLPWATVPWAASPSS
ncbi:hypothetical protein HK405_007337 [Cladochytrium tenue]|nr:hypothetical protein HK405_007337 [Cladochytrium tenue]